MQGLDAAGVDVVSAMDLRTDTDQKPVMPVHHSSAYFQPNLHRPTYRLFFAYSGFCIASWLFFLSVTRGDAALVDKYGFIPVMTAFIVVLVLFSPYDVFSRSERYKFMMYGFCPPHTTSVAHRHIQGSPKMSILPRYQSGIPFGRRACRYRDFLRQSLGRSVVVRLDAEARQQSLDDSQH